MEIIDLDGKILTVTDLAEAIRQAEEFKDYCHQDKELSELNERMQKYWTDIYDKLLRLQSDLK